MKRMLLALTALCAVIAVKAEDVKTGGWNAQFTPVAAEKDLSGVHVAQAGDGSVYVSSTYTQNFTFAGKTVENADEMKSAVVVKYDEKGAEQWALSLYGAAEVTAMTADADGTLYAAGTYSDEVEITAADGSKGSLAAGGMAFILKVSAQGAVLAQKVITATADEEIMASDMYWPFDGDIYFAPRKLKLAGDKLYAAANFTGDVEELGFEAAYLSVGGFMYMENPSRGIFSVNKADLAGAEGVAFVQSSERVSEGQFFADGLSFDATDEGVVLGFFGFGKLTLFAGEKSEALTFQMDGEGNNEHGIVLAKVAADGALTVKKFGAAPLAYGAHPYDVVGMEVMDGNIYLGGTFRGNFPLDNTVTNDFNTAFVASVSADFEKVNWTVANPVESEGVALIVTGEEIHAASTLGTATIATATGVVKEQDADMKFDDAAEFNDSYVAVVAKAGTSVVVITPEMSIHSAIAAPAVEGLNKGARFNLAGQRVGDEFKGIVIENGKKFIVR